MFSKIVADLASITPLAAEILPYESLIKMLEGFRKYKGIHYNLAALSRRYALTLLSLNKLSDAIKALERAFQLREGYLHGTSGGLTLLREITTELCQSYMKIGQPQKVIPICEEMIPKIKNEATSLEHPNDVAQMRSYLSDFYSTWFNACLNACHLDRALRVAQEKAAWSHNEYGLTENRALVYKHMGEHQRMITECERLQYWSPLGESTYHLGDYEKAISLLSPNTGHIGHSLILGLSLLKLRRYAEAIIELNRPFETWDSVESKSSAIPIMYLILLENLCYALALGYHLNGKFDQMPICFDNAASVHEEIRRKPVQRPSDVDERLEYALLKHDIPTFNQTMERMKHDDPSEREYPALERFLDKAHSRARQLRVVDKQLRSQLEQLSQQDEEMADAVTRNALGKHNDFQQSLSDNLGYAVKAADQIFVEMLLEQLRSLPRDLQQTLLESQISNVQSYLLGNRQIQAALEARKEALLNPPDRSASKIRQATSLKNQTKMFIEGNVALVIASSVRNFSQTKLISAKTGYSIHDNNMVKSTRQYKRFLPSDYPHPFDALRTVLSETMNLDGKAARDLSRALNVEERRQDEEQRKQAEECRKEKLHQAALKTHADIQALCAQWSSNPGGSTAPPAAALSQLGAVLNPNASSAGRRQKRKGATQSESAASRKKPRAKKKPESRGEKRKSDTPLKPSDKKARPEASSAAAVSTPSP